MLTLLSKIHNEKGQDGEGNGLPRLLSGDNFIDLITINLIKNISVVVCSLHLWHKTPTKTNALKTLCSHIFVHINETIFTNVIENSIDS